MHSLTICFGPTGTIWTLLFKAEEKAGVLYNAYVDHRMNKAEGGALIGADDFGQSIAIDMDQIHSIMIDDMDQSQMAYIERALHQARSQAKAQSRAMGDPILKTAIMSQGPAVHSPFPNGRFNG